MRGQKGVVKGVHARLRRAVDARVRAYDPLIRLGCHNTIGPTRMLRARRSAAERPDELAPVSIELHHSVAAYRIGEDEVRGSLQCGISIWRMTVVGQTRPSWPRRQVHLCPLSLQKRRSRCLALNGRNVPAAAIVLDKAARSSQPAFTPASRPRTFLS
jgi:hypothetical protein